MRRKVNAMMVGKRVLKTEPADIAFGSMQQLDAQNLIAPNGSS
jgi:hypothetical protein